MDSKAPEEEIVLTGGAGTNKKKCSRKKNCCFYCRGYFTNIAIHLERKHAKEDEVSEFLVLTKGSKERKDIIDIIRKKGNFESTIYNQKLVPARVKSENKEDYKFCPKCKGAYTRGCLRKHFKKCAAALGNTNNRGLMILSRRIYPGLHPTASETLKIVCSRLRDKDDIVRVIKWDRLVISYGNKLCKKLRDPHHYPEIRSKLRLLGRFLLEIHKENGDITDLSSVFKPKFYQNAIDVVNVLARLGNESKMYDCPAVATSMGTLLKKVGKHLKSMYIQEGKRDALTDVEEFLHLLHEDYGTAVNKTAIESQLKLKRTKDVQLPSQSDIKKLYDYVTVLRIKHYKDIKKNGFNLKSWITLAETSLISLQVFNKRRPGESERLTVEDVNNYIKVDTKKDREIFLSLDVEERSAAENYVMIRVRGKLGREVYIIADMQMLKCLKLIIEYRKEAGVPEKNPHVFGLQGGFAEKEFRHLRSCDLMRKYSEICGASNPKLLRATLLRKHLATQAAVIGLPEKDVSDLANHLGHHEKIHKDYYRLPVATREITNMSKLLNNCLAVHENEKIQTSLPSTSTRSSSAIETDVGPREVLQNENVISPTGPPSSDLQLKCNDNGRDMNLSETVASRDNLFTAGVTDLQNKNMNEATLPFSATSDLPLEAVAVDLQNKNTHEATLPLSTSSDLPLEAVAVDLQNKNMNEATLPLSISSNLPLEAVAVNLSTPQNESPSTYNLSPSPSPSFSSPDFSPISFPEVEISSEENDAENEVMVDHDYCENGETVPNTFSVDKIGQLEVANTVDVAQECRKSDADSGTRNNLHGIKDVRIVLTPLFCKEHLSPSEWEPEESLENNSVLHNHEDEINQKALKIVKNRITRRTWSTPEKTILKRTFRENFINKNVPSIKLIREAIQKYPDLKGRTEKQIYAWFTNQFKDPLSSLECKRKTSIRRKTWSTPEKEIVNTIFGKYLKSGRLPQFGMCESAVVTYNELKNRTAEMLYAYINNRIKKDRTAKTTFSPIEKSFQVWSSPKRQLINKQFSQHIIEGKLPTTEECSSFIVSARMNTSVQSVKECVEYEIKRRSFKRRLVF